MNRSSHALATIPSLVVMAAVAGAAAPAMSEVGYLPGAAGAELHYRVLGDGPDPVVVVHGGPGAGMGAILPHVAPLADGRQLVFYDQRGGGRSTLPKDTSELAAEYFVDDLEAVRRYFGLDRMSLIAHSFGAVLVARYAERHPDRIERLVLLDATGPERERAGASARAERPRPEDPTSRRYLEVLRQLMRGTSEDPVAACHELERLGGVLTDGDGQPVWKGTTCDAPPEAVAYYYQHTARLGPASFGAWDFTESLSDLTAQLLVVSGDEPSANLELQRDWAEAVPDGRLFVVPGTGSTAIAERPGLVHAAIDEFLRGVWPEGAVEPRNGSPATTGFRFDALPDLAGADRGGTSRGVAWGDFTGDGYPDLVVSNTDGERLFLYRNAEGRALEPVTGSEVTAVSGNAQGVNWIDVDNDGDLDLFVANWGDANDDGAMKQDNQFFENVSRSANWIVVRLRGTRSNRMGIGARVSVTTGDGEEAVTRYRTLRSTTGFGTMSEPVVHVGLGGSDSVEELRIEWPSGTVDTHRDLRAGVRYVATEAGEIRSVSESSGIETSSPRDP